jgi:small subunit ribosomal protein S9
MADEQTPETPEFPAEPTAPSDEAVEIAGVVEDAPLYAEHEHEAAEQVAAEQPAEPAPVAETPAAETPAAEVPSAETPPVETPAADAPAPVAEAAAEQPAAEAEAAVEDDDEDEEEPAPRVKPAVPGAHLEVDIVPEGADPLGRDAPADPYAIEDEDSQSDGESDEDSAELSQPISTAAIDLAADARYRATGKRKTAIARVILRPGTGVYLVNGRTLEEHFPRQTLQRNIRQPLETVGYQERMDIVARLHGGGISAQAGALRHGISRALLEADPNLRGELKRRGFLTRDSRAKERKKAGLKKARKRPQFSKR